MMQGVPAEQAAILFANDTFYTAFTGGDSQMMADIWSLDHPVSCLHPGGGLLVDPGEIQSSWEQILSAPPPVRCDVMNIQMLGHNHALVHCLEIIGDGALIATNGFVKEVDDQWRMIFHQAGPTRLKPVIEEQIAPAPMVN